MSGCKRTSQLISRIIVTFVVLWVPIHAVGAAGVAGAALRASRPDVTLRLERFMDSFEAKMVYLFPLFRLVIDPFLYAFCTRAFRHDFFQLAARFGVCRARAQVHRTETSSCQAQAQAAWTGFPKATLYSLASSHL